MAGLSCLPSPSAQVGGVGRLEGPWGSCSGFSHSRSCGKARASGALRGTILGSTLIQGSVPLTWCSLILSLMPWLWVLGRVLGHYQSG